MYMIPSATSLPVPVQVLIEPFVINHVTVTAGNAVMDAKMLQSLKYTALRGVWRGVSIFFEHL